TKQEAGFSLIELMVAMTITLIVTGAIYGLLTSGGNAFKREPELSDRQQNVRMAMDLIQRDVSNAGSGMGAWVQAFTNNLDTQGPLVSILPTVGGGSRTIQGQNDFLEILGNDGTCPVLATCKDAGVNLGTPEQ